MEGSKQVDNNNNTTPFHAKKAWFHLSGLNTNSFCLLTSIHMQLNNSVHTLVCYTAVFSVVTQHWAAALRDRTKKRLCSRLYSHTPEPNLLS